MKRLPKVAITLALALNGMSIAYAIGGSGGCDPLRGALGQTIQHGTPADVERELKKWVDNKERGLSTIAVLRISGEKKKEEWRRRQTLNLIEGAHEKGAVCVLGPLLPVAADAGNLEVVRFLLDRPLGLTPGIPTMVLFYSCDNGRYVPSEDQRRLRRQAYAMILDAAAGTINLDGNRRDGSTLLQSCKDPELVSLFVERGARLDILSRNGRTPLEEAVIEAVELGEDEAIPTVRSYALKRASLLARLTPNAQLKSGVEDRVSVSCNRIMSDGRRWNPKTCRELAKFIKASPGTFGTSDRGHNVGR